MIATSKEHGEYLTFVMCIGVFVTSMMWVLTDYVSTFPSWSVIYLITSGLYILVYEISMRKTKIINNPKTEEPKK
jgi:uncharacterized membrane protein